MKFLMGLNESYAQNRVQTLMMDSLPAISKIFSLLMQEERQRSIHNDIPHSFMDRSASASFSSSHVAAVKGNFSGKVNKFYKRPVCSHCNISGHTVDKCYKIHGFPPGHPKHKQKQQPDSKINANQIREGTSPYIKSSDKVMNHLEMC